MKRKYKHRHLITRAISTTRGEVTFFDTAARKNEIVNVILNGKFTAEDFLKKAQPAVNGIVLMVDNVTTETRLYGITVEDFLKYAVDITDEVED